MAGTCMKYADHPNSGVAEYCVDTAAEIDLLPTMTEKAKGKFADNADFDNLPAMGRVCVVGNGEGDILYYMLFSDGWKKMF